MKPLPEILAPAGGIEALTAAMLSGADAVYVGAKSFSARSNAENFTGEALADAVSQCHIRGIRLYLAVNTVVFDNELQEVSSLIDHAAKIGVDALIVQDLGIARLAKEICPAMPLHASTQMSVHTPAGARYLYENGFARVVLARELSLAQIKEIIAACPIETEVFVHGALCMSVSGQCYLSAMAGRRSGNRGLCAQPCRLPFSHKKGDAACGLSLKDLSIVKEINTLKDAGVTSVKIEGRMKRPEYIAAAVNACRCAREETLTPDILETLQAVFSRSGFTDAYLKGKPSEEMFGVRGKEDVTSAAPVLKELQRLYAKEPARVPIKLAYTQQAGRSVCLECLDEDKNRVAAYGDMPEPAINKPTDAERAKASILKLGGTPYYADTVKLDVDETLAVSVSQINALRRECTEKLTLLRGEPIPKQTFTPSLAFEKRNQATRPTLRGRFRRFEQLPIDNCEKLEYIYLPAEEILQHIGSLTPIKDKLIAELPRAMFGLETALAEQLSRLKELGISRLSALNLGAIGLGKQYDMNLHGGFSLNAANSLALVALASAGIADTELSFETDLARARALSGVLKSGIVAYGRLPLMLTRNCPLKHHTDCAACGKKGGYMFDRMGNRFWVACNGTGSEVFNCHTLYLADRLEELLGLDFLTLIFTTEDSSEASAVVNEYLEGGTPPAEFTRGLYYRGVL